MREMSARSLTASVLTNARASRTICWRSANERATLQSISSRADLAPERSNTDGLSSIVHGDRNDPSRRLLAVTNVLGADALLAPGSGGLPGRSDLIACGQLTGHRRLSYGAFKMNNES
jgi:hypothetical protein